MIWFDFFWFQLVSQRVVIDVCTFSIIFYGVEILELNGIVVTIGFVCLICWNLFFWTLFFVEASKKYSDISYPKDAHKIEICFSIYRATGLSPGSKPGAERTRSPEAERCWTKWEIVGLCWANGKICLCNKVRIFSWFSIIYIYMHTCCWFFWIGYQQNKFLIFVVTI